VKANQDIELFDQLLDRVYGLHGLGGDGAQAKGFGEFKQLAGPAARPSARPLRRSSPRDIMLVSFAFSFAMTSGAAL